MLQVKRKKDSPTQLSVTTTGSPVEQLVQLEVLTNHVISQSAKALKTTEENIAGRIANRLYEKYNTDDPETPVQPAQ